MSALTVILANGRREPAEPIELPELARVATGDPRTIVRMGTHGRVPSRARYRVRCQSCGRVALIATISPGTDTQTVCPKTSCRATVRFEVSEAAITLTTTRRA